MQLKATKNKAICRGCRSCESLTACPVDFNYIDCIGCGACSLSCPFGAIKLDEAKRFKRIKIEVDGQEFEVPEKITVKAALAEIGYKFGKFAGDGIFAPCEVGGCYCCALLINSEVKPACISPIKAGMKINTGVPAHFIPKRIVGGFMGHTVGGVGTPWYLKAKGYIEVAVFCAGCNFRCPQCQNWTTTYRGNQDYEHQALTPQQAAYILTKTRHTYGVNRMAISGGESTLNRKWLIEFLKELKRLNPDEEARFHVDTNGSLLTTDYLDELIEAGMTDIGIDLKSWQLETFMRICGLKDRELSKKYKETAWQAVKYLLQNYRDRIFIGIGIPYNEKLISLEEIEVMGKEILKMSANVQVCVLDYRPEFRRKELLRTSFEEMHKIYKILKDIGLKVVICQTAYGYIGP